MPTDIFLPLLTYPDATASEAVEEAARFARSFAKSLTVCAVQIDIPDLTNRLGPTFIDIAGMAAAAEARSRTAGQELLRTAKDQSNLIAVTASSIKVLQVEIGDAVCELARTHDASMVLLDSNNAEKRALAESLIFGSGRPVIVMPERFKGRGVEHIAIAWDGSRAASRAVADAMPFFAQANSVTIITAQGDKEIGDSSVAALSAYFQRHGIKSSHYNVPLGNKSIGATLQQGALSRGAGMLVMGAFGHTRIRDFILGGVTRTTLEDPMLPVLFSH